MKDTPLPSIPDVEEQTRREVASLPPREARPLQPTPRSTMQPPPRQSGPSRLPQHSATMPQPRTQPQPGNIFQRLTSKLRSTPSSQQSKVSRDASPQNPQRKNTGLRMPSLPKAPAPNTVHNDFTSAEQRQAALRARGLVPVTSAGPHRFRDTEGYMMPLSEQEAEIDRRFTVMPGRLSSDENADSEAKKIREAWLAKQSGTSASDGGEWFGEGPRNSDAKERASKDGTVGQKSPICATFVNATTLSPNVGEIGDSSPPTSPLTATVEDFHTAPSTPALFDERLRQSVDHPRSMSPLRNSSTKSGVLFNGGRHASQRSRTSADLSKFLYDSAPATVLTESPRASLAVEDEVSTPLPASPAGTMRMRKAKPPPIIVTSHRPSQDVQARQVVAVAIAAPSGLEVSTSDGRPSLEQRGRPPVGGIAPPPLLAQDLSTSSSDSRSRTTTIPALSPTRTVSSSGASSSLPTPTTTSCARDASISRGSTSHSSENSHEMIGRSRRGTAGELKAKGPTSGAAAVIMEEYSETEPSSEGGGFGMAARANPSQEAAPAPRSPRVQVFDQSATKQNNRKSFSLFGKRSLDLPKETRTASSVSNLRRAFMSPKPLPVSTLDPIPAMESAPEMEMGRKRSKMFDASHLPPSPTFPPPRTSMNSKRNSTGVGLRPSRQAVAPTMHSRGSILLQAHSIEDEESRRLSEMAFLT